MLGKPKEEDFSNEKAEQQLVRERETVDLKQERNELNIFQREQRQPNRVVDFDEKNLLQAHGAELLWH